MEITGGTTRPIYTAIGVEMFVYNAVNAITLGMKLVIAHFILGVQNDKDGTGKAKAQSCNIDEGVDLVAQQVAPGYNEEVSDHAGFFIPFSNFSQDWC
jgi:hypothetical protein